MPGNSVKESRNPRRAVWRNSVPVPSNNHSGNTGGILVLHFNPWMYEIIWLYCRDRPSVSQDAEHVIYLTIYRLSFQSSSKVSRHKFENEYHCTNKIKKQNMHQSKNHNQTVGPSSLLPSVAIPKLLKQEFIPALLLEMWGIEQAPILTYSSSPKLKMSLLYHSGQHWHPHSTFKVGLEF